MTVFVPTNEAVEEFHRNLMEFNTLELESPAKNEVAKGFMCQNSEYCECSKVIYNVDAGLSFDYRKKREVVMSEAPSLQVFCQDLIPNLIQNNVKTTSLTLGSNLCVTSG